MPKILGFLLAKGKASISSNHLDAPFHVIQQDGQFCTIRVGMSMTVILPEGSHPEILGMDLRNHHSHNLSWIQVHTFLPKKKKKEVRTYNLVVFVKIPTSRF